MSVEFAVDPQRGMVTASTPEPIREIVVEALRDNGCSFTIGCSLEVTPGFFLIVLRPEAGPYECITYWYDRKKDFCEWREFRKRAA